jgi:hypothetical protein
MLPLLSFHALAAQRGDGLHPKLLALLRRSDSGETGLSARIEPEASHQLSESQETDSRSPHPLVALPDDNQRPAAESGR